VAWYSGVEYEQYAFLNRATGPYWWAYWSMMTCNVFSPQFMWFKKLRTSIMFSFIISIVVNIGMWFERFVIIVTSLHRDYLPSSWTMFSPTFVDIGIFIGTIGFFFVLFLLYARTFPVIAQAEVKTILKSSGEIIKKKEKKKVIIIQKNISIMSNKVIHALYNDDDILMDAVKQTEKHIIILKKFLLLFLFTDWIKLWDWHQQELQFVHLFMDVLVLQLQHNDELYYDSRLATRYWWKTKFELYSKYASFCTSYV
jgi:hypothetical protein